MIPPIRSGLFALLALGLALPAWAAPVVTAIDGRVRSGDEALEMHSSVGLGDLIESDQDARCSMLMSDSAVIQFCGAQLTMDTPSIDGPRTVLVEHGELKATVGEQPKDNPIEIRTPAALVSAVGTVVHVGVDRGTGITTVSVIEGRALIENIDPAVSGSVVIGLGQQVTVEPGKAPSRRRLVEITQLIDTTTCLRNEDFHQLAISTDRQPVADETFAQIVAVDLIEPAQLALPQVSSGGAALVELDPASLNQTMIAASANDLPCLGITCANEVPPIIESIVTAPMACGAIIHDGCTFQQQPTGSQMMMPMGGAAGSTEP